MRLLLTNMSAVYRQDLFKYLFSKGWYILFYDRDSKDLAYCSETKISQYSYSDVDLFAFVKMLFLKKPEVIVVVGATQYTLVALIYSLIRGSNLTVWWAGTKNSESAISLVKRFVRKIVFSQAQRILAYSEFASDYLKSEFKVEEDKICVPGNMTFDPEPFFLKVQQKRSSLDDNIPALLTVGNLIDSKNHIFLLSVFGMLQKKYTDLRLHIVGEGSERSKLLHCIENNGYKGITLHGHVSHEEMISLYAQASIYVHTAKMDRWPQSVNEAMSCGIPVVASNLSGVSEELLDNGEDLILLDIEVSAFVDAIIMLIEDKEKYKNISDNAYNKMEYLYKRSLKLFNAVDVK